jgi:hypothetical protein
MSWPRTVCLPLLACVSAVFLAACAEQNPSSGSRFARFGSPDFHPPRNLDEESSATSLYLRGTAQVISVDRPTGSAVLNFSGRHVLAYWQTETVYAPVLTGTQLNSTTAPSGAYLEPQAVDRNFPAKPGDTIAFLGMHTGDSIFLQGVTVIAP